MRKLTCVRMLAVAAGFLLGMNLSPALYGQAITGSLLVHVTDATGAVVAGAQLKLTRTQTNVSFKAQTDDRGSYIYPQLLPGRYQLTVERTGFQAKTVKDVRVALAQRARVGVVLQVGVITESVTVSAATVTLLNAGSASIGQVVGEKPVQELPLNGRNFIQLVQLSAGTTPIGTGVSPATSWTGRSDTTLSIAGGRESNNSFLVNGIETRNSRFGNAGIALSVEAIQQFRVQRSTFSAEFGHSSAIVNTTLRSGTNKVHLSVYEFLRNRALDANDFFANQSGRSKPLFIQNQFGTAIGGPVVLPHYNGRSRTFWFFNYEGFRQNAGRTRTGTALSAAQLAGHLADDSTGTGLFPTNSSFCQANPGSEKCMDFINPFTGQPFPGNVIPTNMLDPTTQIATQYLPKPNVAVPAGSAVFPLYNAIAFPKSTNNWDQYNLRIDHNINSNNIIYGSFSSNNGNKYNPALRPYGGDEFPMSDQLVTFTFNHIFSPTVLNVFRFGYNRSSTFRQAETAFGRDFARDVFKLKNTSSNPFDFGVPGFNINGFASAGSMGEAIGAEDENYQYTDNLSINRGRHDFRLGFEISHEIYFQITDFSGNPGFNFDGRFTQTPGYGVGDFLLGIPIRAGGALGNSAQHLYTNLYSGYMEDAWRVTPTLTLNLGLRYEFANSPIERNNKSLVFMPELGRTVTAGHGVRPSIVDPDYNNFAPRLGFAYRPSFLRDTVVRGGIGIYYATDNFNEEQFKVIGPPFYQPQTINSDPDHPTLFMKNMMPAYKASANLNPFSFDRLNRTPYVSQWSLGVQHSFHGNYLAEVDYTGSTGQKLPQRRNLNIATIDPTGTIPIKQRVPYPQYGFILLAYNGGWSSYNALTARLEKHFSNGFYFLTSYTYQKSLDLGSTDEFSALSREFKKWDKGISSFDVPQRFVASYIYDLPFGRGKAFANGFSGIADKLISGWQVTGITTFSKGQYKTPGLGMDWINAGAFTSSRPNIIGDYTAGRGSGPDNYLNPAAFAFPAKHVEGNAGRNSIEMRGLNNWDLGLVKNTSVGERTNLQFRCEMFNAFNHTQFGSASMWNIRSPSFGNIYSTLVSARLLQFALKLSF